MIVATAARVRVLGLVEDMVLALLYGVRRENTVQLVALRMLICPLLHGLEHGALDFNVVIAQRRVVECPQNIIDYFVNRDIRMLPSIEDTTIYMSRCP